MTASSPTNDDNGPDVTLHWPGDDATSRKAERSRQDRDTSSSPRDRGTGTGSSETAPRGDTSSRDSDSTPDRRLLRLRLPAERQGTPENDPALIEPADHGGSPAAALAAQLSTELSQLRAEVSQLRADLEALGRRVEDGEES